MKITKETLKKLIKEELNEAKLKEGVAGGILVSSASEFIKYGNNILSYVDQGMGGHGTDGAVIRAAVKAAQSILARYSKAR